MPAMKEVAELKIDLEFDALCRRLTSEEENFLYLSLTTDGCRDPIVVWANNDDIILDGRNRYRICRQESISYPIKRLALPDRQACIQWIARNQLGRRNLSAEESSYLRGRLYNENKKEVGAPSGNENAKRRPRPRPGQNVGIESDHETPTPTATAEQLANEFKVTPRTIERDAEFAEAVDIIAENVGDAAKQNIISGDSDLTKKDVKEIAELPADEQAEAIEEAKSKKTAKKKAAKKPDLAARCLKLVEGLELLITRVDALAKDQGGHVAYSKDVVRAIKDAITKVRTMERNWKKK